MSNPYAQNWGTTYNGRTTPPFWENPDDDHLHEQLSAEQLPYGMPFQPTQQRGIHHQGLSGLQRRMSICYNNFEEWPDPSIQRWVKECKRKEEEEEHARREEEERAREEQEELLINDADDLMASHQGHPGQSMLLIGTLLLKICTTKSLYQRMLSRKGQKAQEWLDTLVKVLETCPGSDKPIFLEALLRLSRSSGLYPQRMQLGRQVRRGDLPVAQGAFGEVYKGSLGNEAVAIKMFRVYQTTELAKLKRVAWKEAIIWYSLNHANVLPFYGVHQPADNSPKIGFASPWMENGNIGEYLRNNQCPNRLPLLSDIALGMSYLHKNNIVHGDLKAANILVTASGRACLADFGLSRLADATSANCTFIRSTIHGAGTLRWTAPELLDDDEKATTMSDVYSYGCVCYEIMTGNIPFHRVKGDFRVASMVSAGDRPQKPAPSDPDYQDLGLTEPIWSFIETCWQQDANRRPTALDLLRSNLFTSLEDPRPPQKWGNAPAAEFHREASPS